MWIWSARRASRRHTRFEVKVYPAWRLAARDDCPDAGVQGVCFLEGRGYVTPQDVKSIGMDVLRHRVAITYEAEAEEKTSETVIQRDFR